MTTRLLRASSPRRLACGSGMALAALTLFAVGCGGGTPNQDAPAGTQVRQGGVSYAVQSSRELNPFEPDDRTLLTGVPRRKLADMSGAALVGVFLQARNDGSTTHRAIAEPELISAEGQVFKPMPLPAVDAFAYRGRRLAPGAQLPGPDSAAAEGPEDGSMLVYRVPDSTFITDRPFIMRFGSTDRAASVQLDL
jgi:hypothetical protein